MKVLYSKKNGIANKLSGVNLPVDADEINYDNTESGLQSTNVQDAIDEVLDALDDKVDKVAGKGLSTNDYTNEDKTKLDIDTHTLEGNPLSFTTDSAQVAKDAVITIEPIQAGSGDPSPSNVRAISGLSEIGILSCGKNLIDCPNTSISTPSYVIHHYDCEMVKSSGYHVFSFNYHGNTVQAQIQFFTSDSSAVADVIFTLAEGLNTVSINLNGKQSYINFFSNGVGDYTNFQLEANPNFTSYEPYKSSTDLTIQLGQTVYRGTLDLKNGVLTVDRAGIDLGNLNYNYSVDGVYFLSTNLTDIAPASISWPNNNITCSCYKQASDWADLSTNTGINNIIDADDMQVILRDTRYTDVASFKTAIAGQTLVYKLATPYTIQLTPHEISLLQGINNVSTNADSIKLTYSDGVLATLEDVKQVGESVNALSDKVGELNFNAVTFTSVSSDTTIDEYEAYKTGKFVNFRVNFTVTNAHILYDYIIQVSATPKLLSVTFMVLDGTTGGLFAPTSYQVYIDPDGHFCVSGSGLPAGTYIVNGVYMTK